MGHNDSKRSSKHRHSHEKSDREHKNKRKHGSNKEGSHKRVRKDDSDHIHIVDDDPNDDDMWVEKNIDMDGEQVRRKWFCILQY